MKFSGVITALVTPFKNGEVDESSLKNLVAQQMSMGLDGFVVSGTTAESPVLSIAEKKRLFEIVSNECGRSVPVIVGTGSNCTRTTIEHTQLAESWGADAALVVVPYYNKPPQAGLVAHFKAVVENTSLPVILYNVPSRTIVSLSLESIVELAKLPNVVGIKEASANPDLAKKIAEHCGPDFLISSGDDASFLQIIRNGGRGVISVASHLIGKEMKEFSLRLQRGDNSAEEDYRKYLKLVDLLFVEPNPIPVKAALNKLGVIGTDELRLPLVPMSQAGRAELFTEMKSLGLM